MARDREYEMLLSKYNIAIAQIRDLREQITTKERQWKAQEERWEVVEGHMRKLCEMILAKDKSEMTLGDGRTWNTFTTDEMISKAKTCFVRYNDDRTEILNRVMNVAEERGRELESLRDQISRIMTSGMAESVSADDLLKKAEKEREEQEAISKAPNATQKAIADGRVVAIIEEDDDVDEREAEIMQSMMEAAEQAKLMPSSPSVARCRQKSDLIEESKNKAVAQVIDLQGSYMNKCEELEWVILKVIGGQGVARKPDILEAVLREIDVKVSQFNNSIVMLHDMDALSKEMIELPLSKRVSIYKLTAIGETMFRTQFKMEPVKSEADLVIKEHSTLVHGYGILDIEKAMIESGRYLSVSSYNRANAFPVKIGGQDLQYIPDLICKKPKYKEFFEYERGTHKQIDFRTKCNKMCQVTRFLNFITPNKGAAEKIMSQVDDWIESRGVKSLKNIHVKIFTATSIRKSEDNYLVYYDLNKGATPVVNKISPV